MAKKPKTAAIDAALAKRGQRASALFDATLKNLPDLVRGAGPGALEALGDAYGVGKKYVQSRTPQQVAGDVAKGLGAVGDATARYATDRTQNPLKLLGDAYGVGKDIVTAVPQAVGDVARLSERAQALKATDPAAARRMQAGIAMAAMGVMPGVRTGKKVAKAVDEAEKLAARYLPPAENAQRTQISGTTPTYVKAKALLDKYQLEGKTIDFGAGLGEGAKVLGADTYEPFPRIGFDPTYKSSSDIPGDTYHRLTNLNVLNVVPKDTRDTIVKDIGRVLAPGGKAIITTRGRDVMTAAGEVGPEAMSKITTRGTYQKGFTPEELHTYIRDTLGEGYDVDRVKLGPAGVVVTKQTPAAEKLAAKYGVEAPAKVAKSIATKASQPLPAIVGRASPAQEVLRLRAAQLDIPKQKDRLQPSGYEVFKTTPEAYERTSRWVPQTSREEVQALQPRLPEGREYPLEGRIQPLIDDREALSRFMAKSIEDVDPNLPASRFYQTGPMYEGLAEAGGLGEQGAKDYMEKWFRPAFAGSSPRTPTPQNLRNTTLLNYLKASGEELPGYYERKGNFKGYNMLGSHYDLTDRLSSGAIDIGKNPKPYGYGHASVGNLNHVAADTHNIRAILMNYDRMNPGGVPKGWFKTPEAWEAYKGGAGFKAATDIDDSLRSATISKGREAQVEYGPMTDISHDIGRILNIPSSTGQARVWFKEGENTGLMSPEKSIPNLANDAIDITAQGLGITPEEVLRLMAKHETMLMAKGGLAEKYGV